MRKIKFISLIILTTLLVIWLTACSRVREDESFTGLFTLGITDTPLDGVSKVIVQFTGIEIQSALGERLDFDFDLPRQIDLLALSGGNREFLLYDKPLDAGHYEWIRLKVDAESNLLDSYVELKDGSKRSLKIPSENKTGLKLVRGFTVPLNGIADFTIDFDLRKSVHTAPGENADYILRPTLRMVDNAEVGRIRGVIDPILINDLFNPACAVYIFEGTEVIPDDIDGLDADPITGAEVKLETGEYVYQAAFLSPGDYTIALTYQAGHDNPETDDPIAFEETSLITISSGTETRYDFR